MANNKTKVDRLKDMMPEHFGVKTNPNWSALLDAIGTSDQKTTDLIEEVHKQFFVKTAYRPYLDVLGNNENIQRPPQVGMDDPTFRNFIPVLSYQPKQIKQIIDQLLNIFFAQTSTTAYVTSQNNSPYALANGDSFNYLVDEVNTENIIFNANDFTDISHATVDEVVAAWNRQAQYSYTIHYHNSITKQDFIQLFTKTVGSTGSIRILGGEAAIAFAFNGFNLLAGLGANTQWVVTKVGQLVTMTYLSGGSPGINQLQIGDILISNLPGNVGSFTITNVDISNGSIQFINLFATPGTFTQTSVNDTKYLTPNKYVAYTNPQRAMTWETVYGQITVEMPTTPPVVKRSLAGSIHLNGSTSVMTNWDSPTSLTVVDATNFPNSGVFALQEVTEITSNIVTPSENDVSTTLINGRLIGNYTRYSYTSRTAATTTGNLTIGSPVITNLVSMAGIALGQTVFTEGMLGRATVIAVDLINNTITASANATVTNSQSVAFGGNTFTGITPNLPALATVNQLNLTSLTRVSNIVTGTSPTPTGFNSGDIVFIYGSSGVTMGTITGNTALDSDLLTNVTSVAGLFVGNVLNGVGIPLNTTVEAISGSGPYVVSMSNAATASGPVIATFGQNMNGSFTVLTTPNPYTFTYQLFGADGSATAPGSSEVDAIGLANSGSTVILLDSVPAVTTGILGPYVWDPAAPYVLSENTTSIQDTILAGKIIKLLDIGVNTIPNAEGSVIFDYGLPTQEGPIRYLYKPTPTTIALDPSYVFLQPHSIGSAITALSHFGPHIVSSNGVDFPPYVTDPSVARVALENLILSVKSAGIFVEFLIKFPEQLYGTLNVYNDPNFIEQQ